MRRGACVSIVRKSVGGSSMAYLNGTDRLAGMEGRKLQKQPATLFAAYSIQL